MINIGTYIQANEQINGENGALGEIDVANRPLKELVSLFNSGNADTQVRRINFKIDGAQQIADGVISDDVVWFNNTTEKYELASWDSTQSMGFIDVENLQIYSFGEYTFKNINDLIPGHAYSISKLNAGKIVSNTDVINSSYSHMGVARANNKIEINKFVDSVFDSVTINDITSSLGTVYSSSKTEAEITNRATKIYYFTNTSNNTSLAPNPTKLYNLPLNSTIMDLTSNQIYTKKSNNGLTIDSALGVGLSSGAVTKLKLDWTNLVGTPSFATVSTSGSYADLNNKPVNVTTTVDGFMSKDDKSKLNGINPEVGAVVSSVVRRGTDGSIIAGGTSNFGNINAGTVSASLTGTATNASNLSNYSLEELKLIFFPRGIVTMWSGSTTTIPVGWALCNGTNGTPNLLDRFIVGAGQTYGVGYTGGRTDAINVSHTHSAWTDVQGNHTHGLKSRVIYQPNGENRAVDPVSGNEIVSNTEFAGAHTHNVGVNASGESGANQNLPPYYALAYIMKL
jgi:hypothetical protein